MASLSSKSEPRNPRSIVRRVPVFITVLLIGVFLLMTGISFFVARRIVNQQVHKSIKVVAAARHESFELFFERHRRRIELYASNPSLRQETFSLLAASSETKPKEHDDLQRRLDQTKEQFWEVADSWVLDAKANVLVSTSAKPPPSVDAASESFQQALQGTFVATPIQYGDSLVSLFFTPMRDEDDSVKAVVCVAFDVEAVKKIIFSDSGLGNTGDIMIITIENGHLRYLLPDRPRPFKTLQHAPELVEAIDARKRITEMELRLGDVDVLATYQPITFQPGLRNWGMLTTITSSEAYAPVYRLAQMLCLCQAVLLLMVWIATQRYARQFTAPLDHLTQVVEKFASGKRSVRASINTGDEFETLGDAFNELANAVLRTEHDLEQRVLSRTNQLQREADNRKKIQNQLVEARDAAERANRAKSQFLANMSHEIRTPMNGILGMAQLLEAGELQTQQREQLTAMQQCAMWLLQLLNDILDFSKIEAGMLSLEKSPFDFRDCVDMTLKTLAVRAFEKDLELVCNIDQSVPNRIVSDPGRIRQILFNLIGNAIKFTDTGDVLVHIGAKQLEYTKVELTIAVTDSGIGISPENLPHIFESFRQADSSTTREFGGSGLGLSISSQLAKALGGSITAESQLGHGSTFRVVLPIRFLHDASDQTSEFSDRQFTAIVLDDHAQSRHATCDMLQAWGIIAHATSDLAQAMALMEQHSISILLIDSTLPGETTEQCVAQIRQRPAAAELPIVVMHRSCTPNQLQSWKQLKLEHISKPLGHRDFRNLLRRRLLGQTEYQQDVDISTHLTTADGNPLSVLLVEDSLVNQQVAVGLLRILGCDVELAHHGGEAIEMVQAKAYDVVLMDVQMPVVDGIKATVTIRQLEANTQQHLKIIAMTAAAMKGDRERCVRAGMDGYVSKPITRDNLLAEIHRVVFGNSATDASDSGIWENGPSSSMSTLSTSETNRVNQIPSETESSELPAVTPAFAAIDQLANDYGKPEAIAIAQSLLQEAPELIEKIQRWDKSQSPGDLIRWVHTLKGSAQVLSFSIVVRHAAAMELALRKDQWPQALEMRQELFAQTSSMLKVVQQWVDQNSDSS